MKRRDFLRLIGVATPAIVATARAIVENQPAEPVWPEMNLERYVQESDDEPFMLQTDLSARDLKFPIRGPGLASLVKSDLGAVYNSVV